MPLFLPLRQDYLVNRLPLYVMGVPALWAMPLAELREHLRTQLCRAEAELFEVSSPASLASSLPALSFCVFSTLPSPLPPASSPPAWG